MPNLIVKVPENVFDDDARQALGRGIHAAAKAVEGFGDDPRQEFLTWIVIEEVKSGFFFAGGADQTSRVIPVIVFFYPPAGVVDEPTRTKAVDLFHKAVVAAKPASDPRQVATSVMVWDVADGTWGASGALWHLPDFARAAGYQHLKHLVTA